MGGDPVVIGRLQDEVPTAEKEQVTQGIIERVFDEPDDLFNEDRDAAVAPGKKEGAVENMDRFARLFEESEGGG